MKNINGLLLTLILIIVFVGILPVYNNVYGMHFYVGGKGGVSINTMNFSSNNTDVRNDLRAPYDSRKSAGYNMSNLLVSGLLVPWNNIPFCLRADFGWVTKGVSLGGDFSEMRYKEFTPTERVDQRTHMDEQWNLNYTTISIIPKAMLEIGKRKNLVIDAGIGFFFSQMLSGSRNKNNKVGIYSNNQLVRDYIDNSSPDAKNWVRSTDMGIVFSVGTHYEAIPNLRFGFEFRYDLGLYDIANSNFKYKYARNPGIDPVETSYTDGIDTGEYGYDGRPFYKYNDPDSDGYINTRSFMILFTVDYRMDSIFRSSKKKK